VPRLGKATVTDAPLTPPPGTQEPVSYSIVPDEAVPRGSDLTFTVTRTGPLGPASLEYRFEQPGTMTAVDAIPPRVEFPEGKADASLVITAGQYWKCEAPPVVTLEDGKGTYAAARFTNPPPPSCAPPPWWKRVLVWIGDNLPVALGGAALAGAVLTHLLWKPPIVPSCTINPGALSMLPLEQPASRWPKFAADVVIQPGECSVTQPLPKVEPADG